MKILMIVPVYKRPEIVRAAYDSIKRLPVERLFIVSPEDQFLKENMKTLKSDTIVEYSNAMLGMKHNAGIKFALDNMEFDYMMNCGSDDLICPTLLDLYKPYMEAEEKFFGIDSCYFFDTLTGNTVYIMNYNEGYPIGGGRMIHRSVIEQMYKEKVPLYANQRMSGLDSNSQNRIFDTLGIRPITIPVNGHPYLVDLKSGTNINHFNFYRNRPLTPRTVIDRVHQQTHKFPEIWKSR